MCLPARWTRTILLPSKVDAIFAAGDFRGCLLDPIHTESIVSPLTRLSNPRTMVSTSGNSGIESGYRKRAIAEVRSQIAEVESKTSTQTREGSVRVYFCNLTSNFCNFLPLQFLLQIAPRHSNSVC
jgi:hypothetical protein